MVIVNKDNYELVITECEAYLKVTNEAIKRTYCFRVASINNSDHKKLVIYNFICRNSRPDIRYYSYAKYKDYIKRRVDEFFKNYSIEVLDTGDYNIIHS